MGAIGRWIWPGLFTIAILSFLAVWTAADRIEADISSRTIVALEENGLAWADLAIDGRDVRLSGSASTASSRESAASTVLRTYGVRIVDDRTDLVAEQSPYTFSAERVPSPDGGSITFRGFVPDDPSREVLVQQAKERFPGLTVTDELVLARGAPESYRTNAEFALERLAELARGTVAFSDTELSIQGTAADADSYDTARAALAGTLPTNANVVSQNIVPPLATPYDWSAEKTDTTIVLEGSVPNETVRAGTLAAIRASSPDLAVTDKRRSASGEPDTFDTMATQAISLLADISEGTLTVSDTDLTMTGRARDRAALDRLTAMEGATPQSGFTSTTLDIAPIVATPYQWSVSRSDDGIVLDGFVPSKTDGVQTAQAITSRFARVPLNDQTLVADGAPSNFRAYQSYAIDMLAHLSSGTVQLVDGLLDVQGLAASVAAYDAAMRQLAGGKPEGLVVEQASIVPAQVSPYVWSARRDGETVSLTGFTQTQESRAAVLAKTRAVLPNQTVSDAMDLGSGAGETYLADIETGLRLLADMSAGTAELSDDTLTISGLAMNAEAFERIVDRAEGMDSPVDVADVTAPPASPYTWSASRDGTAISLDGFVEARAVRATIRTGIESAVPAAQIDDRTRIATGAPDGLDMARIAAIEALGSLNTGTVAISDQTVSITGEAASSEAYADLAQILSAGLPDRYSLDAERIMPPRIVGDYAFSVERTASGITLSGHIPNKAARRAIVQSAADLNAGPVSDELKFAAGAPDGFEAAVSYAIAALPNLNVGSVEIADGTITLAGDASSVTAFETMQRGLEATGPAGFTIAGQDIRPASISPYTWSIDNSGDTVVLSGFLPDESLRDPLQENAHALLGKSIEDDQRIAAGAPSGFDRATRAAIVALAGLDRSEASLSGKFLTVRGHASSEALTGAVEESLRITLSDSDVAVRTFISFPEPVSEPVPEPVPEPASMSEPAPASAPPAEPIPVPDPQSDVVDNTAAEPDAIVKPEQTTAPAVEPSSDATAEVEPVVEPKPEPAIVTPPPRTEATTDDVVPPSVDVPTGPASREQSAAQNPELQPDDPANAAGIELPPAPGAAVQTADRPTDEPVVQESAEDAIEIEPKPAPVPAPDQSQPEPPVVFAPTRPAEPLPVAPEPVEDVQATALQPSPESEQDAAVAALEPPQVPEAPEPACPTDFSSLLDGRAVQFATARAVIKEESLPMLDRIAQDIAQCGTVRIEVAGHTDSRGTEAYNQALSEARAQAVVTYLTKRGGTNSQLAAKGYGETRPVASNDRPESRALNRRIEFTLLP